MPETVSFTLNNKPVTLKTNPERSLLWVLRTDFKLTGTKFGCGEGHCGSCTVLLDDLAVRACLLKLKQVTNKSLVTIEGLAKGDQLHPVQKAFIEHDGLQCGFCTPGMVLAGVSFLKRNPNPTREQIVRGLDQNLCRCGAHTRIVQAIETAAAELKAGSKT